MSFTLPFQGWNLEPVLRLAVGVKVTEAEWGTVSSYFYFVLHQRWYQSCNRHETAYYECWQLRSEARWSDGVHFLTTKQILHSTNKGEMIHKAT